MAETTALRLGVDVGGTRLKLAALEGGDAARVLARRVHAVRPEDRSPSGLVASLRAGVTALLSEIKKPDHGAQKIAGVGLGVAGVLDVAQGRIIESPNLPWLNNFPLGPALSEALNLPVWADNDANCVGWGEAIMGAGRGAPNQITLALGTGLGGAIILGGRLHRGKGGRAGELGHLCVQPEGAPCGCGGRGCLEQYASQTGLLRMMAEERLLPPDRAPHPDDILALFANARAGQARAAAVVDRAGEALGQAIAGLYRSLGVPLFVIAGGIAAALEDLHPAMQAAIDAHAPKHPPNSPEVIAGILGTDAGCIGAATLVNERP